MNCQNKLLCSINVSVNVVNVVVLVVADDVVLEYQDWLKKTNLMLWLH
jgi:hypothetical protein